MSQFRCTIHECTFSLEAPAEATEVLRNQCSWAVCPLCDRQERTALVEEIHRLQKQNTALIAAIEIKREHLIQAI